MTAPERFAESQIPLAPRAPSIHDPYRLFAQAPSCKHPSRNLILAPSVHSALSPGKIGLSSQKLIAKLDARATAQTLRLRLILRLHDADDHLLTVDAESKGVL
jgi:hypothetical protein